MATYCDGVLRGRVPETTVEMTKDRARKMAVRAAAAGGGHARAARLHAGSTAQLHLDLARAFRAAGWPVEVEKNLLERGRRIMFPGPAHLEISRGFSSDPDFDPDDPDQADQDEPPTISCTAPPAPDFDRPTYVDFEVTAAGISADELVRRTAEQVAAGRARALAELVNDAECAICGDAYPRRHLLDATAARDLSLCPACVFDGDLMTRALPEQLAYQFDSLAFGDLGVAAGWSAVAALLACAAGPNLASRLERAWRRRVFEIPLRHWNDPGELWIWLPPARRPDALAHFGPGASLRAVADAVDRAHPGIRDTFRRRLADELEYDPDEPRERTDYLVPQLWDAVIAYAVTFMTMAVERPGQRAAWHVDQSFDEAVLSDHFERLGSVLDPTGDLSVVFTLGTGVSVVAEELGWRGDLDDDLESADGEPGDENPTRA